MTEYDYKYVKGLLDHEQPMPVDHVLILTLMRILVADHELKIENSRLSAIYEGHYGW